MIQGINIELNPMVNKGNEKIISKDTKDNKSFNNMLKNEKNNISKKDVAETVDVKDENITEIPDCIIEQLSIILSLLPSINEKLPSENNIVQTLLSNIEEINIVNDGEFKGKDSVFNNLESNPLIVGKSDLKDIQSLLNQFIVKLDEYTEDNLESLILGNKSLESNLSELKEEVKSLNSIISSELSKVDKESVIQFKNVIKDKLNTNESKVVSVADKVFKTEVESLPPVEGSDPKGSLEWSEEKVLKSILNDGGEDKISTKFTLINNNISLRNIEVVDKVEVINKVNIVEDIVKAVKYITTNNIKELVVRVNPKELGEVAIRVIQEDGIMKANIKASSKETYSILSQNLGDIKNYLDQQNIKIQSVDIGLYEDTTYFKEDFQGQTFNQERRESESSNKHMEANSFLVEEEVQENEIYILSNINMLA